MKINDFLTEQWMNDYENQAVYNMTDTCIQPLSFVELSSMDTEHLLDNIILDYGTITGDIGFKKEILKLYRTGSVEDITLFNGCLEANAHVMNALLEPEDIIIAFTPGYQQFYDYPASFGCKTILIPLVEEENWQPDMNQFKKAMEQDIKMIIMNNPANPTGSFFTKDILDEMVVLAKKQKTWILSDEVYQGLNDTEYAISDLYDYGISTSSLSKVFSLAGLRIGWVKANQECIHLLNVRRDYTMISTGPLIDTCAKIALSHREELVERGKSIVQKNKDILHNWLQNHPQFSIVMPVSGTVGFLKYDAPINSEVLAKKLLQDTGVFFVPGSCFDCEYHLRIGFTAKHESFQKGLELLAEWIDENVETFA